MIKHQVDLSTPWSFSYWTWLIKLGGRPPIYFTFSYLVFGGYFCFINCVKALFRVPNWSWVTFWLAGTFDLLPSELKCLATALFPMKNCGALVGLYLLDLLSAEILVNMTVHFVWVTLIPLVAVEYISRFD